MLEKTMSKPVDVGSLRKGGYTVIDGEACRIVDLSRSKPGKHGSAKARVVAIGAFDNIKRSFVKPVSAQVEVPIIEKRTGQVLSVMSGSVQIMDLETYQVSENALPEEEDLRSKLRNGAEIEYWSILGKTKIMKVKG
jgi:translation initiation factor 5A